MKEKSSMKEIYKWLRNPIRDNEGVLNAEVVTLSQFFNIYLKNKAYEYNFHDSAIRRFFQGEWTLNNYEKLKQLFHRYPNNNDVVEQLTDFLLKQKVNLNQIQQVINLEYIKQLRILCIPKSHIINDTIFKEFIQTFLIERGNMKSNIVSILLNDKSTLDIIKQAFTSPSVSYTTNYEVWEKLGDGVLKGLLSYYFTRRFPEILTDIRAPEILTDIGKTYENKTFFSILFDKLKLYNIGSYKEELVHIHPRKSIDRVHGDYILTYLDKSTKEDMFEAFFGVIQYIIDSKIQIGLGNAICYNIYASIMDEEELFIDTDTLKEPISKLKEIFEKSGEYDRPIGSKKPSENIDKFIYSDDLEEGTGINTGMIRMKLTMIFNPDRENKGRGLLKKFKLTSPIIETLWSDYVEDKDTAKFNVSKKAIDLLKEKYNIEWKILLNK